MAVFVSYQRADEYTARAVCQALGRYRIETYLDVLDPALPSPQQVTSIIVRELDRCTHLMAVVSLTTAQSWWVPFEIGVATKGERRISTFKVGDPRLPEYLSAWPVLTSTAQIEKFARRYFQDNAHLARSYELSEAATKRIATAAQFHQELKRDLGQLR